jgi:hypothetical protein
VRLDQQAILCGEMLDGRNDAKRSTLFVDDVQPDEIVVEVLAFCELQRGTKDTNGLADEALGLLDRRNALKVEDEAPTAAANSADDELQRTSRVVENELRAGNDRVFTNARRHARYLAANTEDACNTAGGYE